jgi:hypothetical protein
VAALMSAGPTRVLVHVLMRALMHVRASACQNPIAIRAGDRVPGVWQVVTREAGAWRRVWSSTGTSVGLSRDRTYHAGLRDSAHAPTHPARAVAARHEPYRPQPGFRRFTCLFHTTNHFFDKGKPV